MCAAGLTWLSVAGARVSSDQTFALVLLHLPKLRHLDLSGILSFTARSLPGLLHLQSLTSLDIRSTSATADAAAVDVLVKLRNCRRLALSVGGEEGYGRQQQQWQQPLSEVACRRRGAAVASSAYASTSSSSIQNPPAGRHASPSSSSLSPTVVTAVAGAGEGLEAYAYMGRLGDAQSLRQLLLGGSTPSLTEYCRSRLPPWIDVR